MPRRDWSLEVCVRHLETVIGETGRLWLTTVVFLSAAIRSHSGKKKVILPPFSKMRVEKEEMEGKKTSR